MDYKGEQDYEIIPEWNDNKDDTHPIKVQCRYLTPPERDRVFGAELVQGADGETVAKLITDKGYAVRVSIKSIDNFSYNGIKIEKADAFMALRDPGVDDLFDEIANDILIRNKRRVTKNS